MSIARSAAPYKPGVPPHTDSNCPRQPLPTTATAAMKGAVQHCFLHSAVECECGGVQNLILQTHRVRTKQTQRHVAIIVP